MLYNNALHMAAAILLPPFRPCAIMYGTCVPVSYTHLYGVFAIYQIGIGLGYQDMETVHHYTMDLYFESSAMILALITLGKFLETKSKGKTSEAITKLLHLAPKTATVIRNGEEQEIPVEEVVVCLLYTSRCV